ncbi:MAG TPA: hypothetical protein VK974_06660 [Methylophilaceae bacterium]|nr:hypothetical protein [Methylophilaceae bacterium]
MDNTSVQKLSSALIKSAVIISLAFIFSAKLMSPKVGRYMVTPSKENWVLVSDTKTGRSWECVNRQQYVQTLELIAATYADSDEDVEQKANHMNISVTETINLYSII